MKPGSWSKYNKQLPPSLVPVEFLFSPKLMNWGASATHISFSVLAFQAPNRITSYVRVAAGKGF